MILQYSVELTDEKHPMMVEEKKIPYEITEMNCPSRIVEMFNRCFHLNKLAEEHVYLMALDSKLNLLGVCEVSHGSVVSSQSGCREVFIRALLMGASSIVLAHNHPSGSVEPSEEDKIVAMRIEESGKLLGVQLQDFLVVGDGYSSMRKIGVVG